MRKKFYFESLKGSAHSEQICVNGDDIKTDLREVGFGGYGVDSSGSEKGPEAGFCKKVMGLLVS
jgi:hypothetical protein